VYELRICTKIPNANCGPVQNAYIGIIGRVRRFIHRFVYSHEFVFSIFVQIRNSYTTMFASETTVRVRYGETDRMGYSYYGNYAEYYEVGRVEALRALGWNYKDMEDSGILLPVYTFSIKYFKPAHYDDQLTVKTMIRELPSTRLKFEYEMFNINGEKINEGETTLVFINAETKKPCGAPEAFVQALKPYF
jgi:acyl-CoA thioester hydrolase